MTETKIETINEELDELNDGSRYKTTKLIVRSITALSFTLFTAYQIVVALNIETGRVGRLIGVGFYMLITLASIFALIHQHGIRIVRTILLVGGFAMLFIFRLLNAPTIFGSLDFSNMPSVLNFVTYVTSQLGTFILLLYYLAIRTNKNIKNRQKVTVILMSVVVALYVVCLISDCFLRIQYHLSVDLNLSLALISRVLFFLGFAGTAVGFMIPSERGDKTLDEYVNKEQSDSDFMVDSPEYDSRDNSNNMIPPAISDNDFMMGVPETKSSAKDKDKRVSPVVETDFMMGVPETSRSRRDKERRVSPSLEDANIVFADVDSSRSRNKKRRH